MMIPDEVIEQVRDAADLVGVIGETVTLKKTGTDWRGPCPFHGGTHRNFAVLPRKGMFYCFVCHEAGDVFTWYMKRAGLDYPSAVREVARRVGITIPERAAREGPDPREPLFAAVAAAHEWLARQFRDSPEAAEARRYVQEREIQPEQAAELGLGFAPRGRVLLEELARLGIPEAVMLEAGLAVRREDGTVVPRFRGRLIFPIHDLRGRVVGFGGRLLGPGEPKYLNSPESPIYHKGGVLYNLHAARSAIRQEESVLLVEGYFDVIRLVLAGIENVVAPLGTALTAEQAALLKRFAPAAVLLYDSDAAGLRATFRAGDELLRHGMRVRVATMPDGEDPDSLVRAGGATALQPVLKDGLDLLERKLQLLERRGWFEGVEHRRDALDRLLPTLRAAVDPITRDLYVGLVAERVGVSREVLMNELRAAPPRPAPVAASAETGGTWRAAAPEQSGPRVASEVKEEEKLIRCLLADRGLIPRAREAVSRDLVVTPILREIYAALIDAPADEPDGEIATRLTADAVRRWQRLLAKNAELPGGKSWSDELESVLNRIRSRPVMRTSGAAASPEEIRRGVESLPRSEQLARAIRKQAAGARKSTRARGSRADSPQED